MILHTSHLDRRLAAIHQRLIRRCALTVITEFVLILLPVATLLACLDCTLRPTAIGRLAELIVLLLATAASVARHLPALAHLWTRPQTAAALLEQINPSFAGRLLSYVDFRSRRQPNESASKELIEAMCRQIEQQTIGFIPEQVVSMQPLRTRMAVAGMLLVFACALSALQPHMVQTWALRVAHPFAEIGWPPRTRIVGLQAAQRVRRGDFLRITGKISGRIPADCEIDTLPSTQATPESSSQGRSIRIPVGLDGAFTTTLGPVIQPTTIRARAGDADTSTITVDVIDPPYLADLAITCRYPEYLHRPDEPITSRDLRVPVGTQVDLVATSDKPVGAMTLILMANNVQTREPLRRISSTQGSASFIVQSLGWYAIGLEDSLGTSENEPPRHVIAAIENRHPVITLEYPGTDVSVAATTILPLEFEASDDFGIMAVRIVWQIKPFGAASAPPPSQTPIPLATPTCQLSSRFMWNLADTQAHPGDEIHFHLEAQDVGTHIAPALADTDKSQTRVLKVVDPTMYRSEHLARLSAVMNDINRLTTQVSAAWDEVSSIARLLRLQPASCPAEFIGRLTTEREQERSLAAQADAIAVQLDRLVDEWSISMPSQTTSPEGSQLLATVMAHLAAGPMAEAPAALSLAIAQCEKSAQDALAQLAKVQHAQTEALRILAKLSSVLAGPATKQTGTQIGKPTPFLTEQGFEHAQKTLAAEMRDSLKSIPFTTADPKAKPRPQPKVAKDQAAAVTGQRGQGSARSARETTVGGGPAQSSPLPSPTITDAIPSWQWNLPVRAQAVLQQATTEPFPPGQAAAIMRYYERLNRELGERP